MIVPWQQLSPEALRGLIEEFVTRDGTDYGESEVSLERRVEQVLARLRSGEAVLLFSESTAECSIVAKDRIDK
ncbi:YheU family protein [Marinobacterium sp. D7]|uniref:YheU family protein n=1 Tax=Marinobacterium ramblicola TaxID=2849041 RepID=UPI001C2D12F9|nr:YheU family protein [Marinobacterium ramblicola]